MQETDDYSGPIMQWMCEQGLAGGKKGDAANRNNATYWLQKFGRAGQKQKTSPVLDITTFSPWADRLNTSFSDFRKSPDAFEFVSDRGHALTLWTKAFMIDPTTGLERQLELN